MSACSRLACRRWLLVLALPFLLFVSVLSLSGCGGDKEEPPGYPPNGVFLLVEFKPGVTEAQRAALYEKYHLRIGSGKPYDVIHGSDPPPGHTNPYLVQVRDDMDEEMQIIKLQEDIGKEPDVVYVSTLPSFGNIPG